MGSYSNATVPITALGKNSNSWVKPFDEAAGFLILETGEILPHLTHPGALLGRLRARIQPNGERNRKPRHS